MNNINRREFIKKSSLGMGVIMTSNLWLNKLFAKEDIEFEDIFQCSNEDIKKLLEIALSKGCDFSEFFFEYKVFNSVTMQEDIIKSSSQSIILGVGIRALKGNQEGYAYTNDLSFEKIKKAALSASAIANGPSKVKVANLNVLKPKIQAYDLDQPLSKLELEQKIELIKEAYFSAQNYDNRIVKVSSSLGEELQIVKIANSEGLVISDIRPQVRLSTTATAQDKNVKNTGSYNHGGRVGLNYYKNVITPKEIGRRAAEEAIILLSAKDAPAGEMPVVLGKEQSGVMIHEAVGHPLEGDSNWKKTSIMWDKFGQMVANPIVTIYDDATIPYYRGSLNIDDEGTFTENVILIDKGRLVGLLNDRISAMMLNQKRNGHARRQSYMYPPIPRMNNTILASGDTTPEEIISSVKKGIYASTYQGGQVSDTGKFTFSVNLGYLIENGKLTSPIKNVTLIGTNVQILKEVELIGNDVGYFLGSCGKSGQSVPVTCGTPTLKIKRMTVGGVV